METRGNILSTLTLNRKDVTGMEIRGVSRLTFACALAGLLWLAGANAWAQDGPRLELGVSSQKEVETVKDGKKTLEMVPVDKVKPGEVLVYTITYTNTGKGEARDALIVDPIPEGTDYMLGSAGGEGADVTCSIDGGKSYAKEPCMREVKMPDGTTRQEEAGPEMYTHIRWVVKSVPPGGSGEVKFKVKVEE